MLNFVHQIFEASATEFSDSIAIEFDGQEITYQQLNKRANIIGNVLRERGVGKDIIVGVFLEPGIQVVAALLGILKTGGTYLPLSKKFSMAQVTSIFGNTRPAVLILNRHTAECLDSLDTELKLAADCLLFLERTGPMRLVNNRTGLANELSEFDVSFEKNISNTARPDDGCYIYHTSGSTGVPKAILGKHESLAHFIQWEIGEFDIRRYRISQLIQLTFDASLRDILVPLCSGGILCIPGQDISSNISSLITWIKNSGINLIHTVPSLMRLIVSEVRQSGASWQGFPSLKHLLLSGEMLYAKDIESWRAVVDKNTELVNFYGPTEATMIKSFHRISAIPSDPSQPIHVGHPIANTFIAIVNENRLCRIGEIGEIYIRTKYLTKGYVKNQAATARAFVQNPLITDAADIVYRTGDLGRYLPDRSVEVIGRIDNQIKINGIRTDLNEIEKAVLTIEGVDQAVVVVRTRDEINQDIVCYYRGTTLDSSTLHNETKRLLNASLVPSYWIHMQAFPQNANGKVDKNNLPDPYENTRTARQPGASSDVCEKVIEIVEDLVGRRVTSNLDDFFSIGGNSLKAIQLTSRLKKIFQRDIDIQSIFERRTIQGISECIENAVKVEHVPIPVLGKQDSYALSHAQARLWILSQRVDHRIAYNVPRAYRIKGGLNVEVLRFAFKALQARHEILRTTFRLVNGRPQQFVDPVDKVNPDFSVLEFQNASDPEGLIRETLEDAAKYIFDLETGPLLKVMLMRRSLNEYVLMINMPHIIFDGWSRRIMVDEIITLYNALARGENDPLPPLKNQYKDYAAWHNAYLGSTAAIEARAFWTMQLQSTQELKLPIDHARPLIRNSEGNAHKFIVESTTKNEIDILCKGLGVSQNVLLLSAVFALLYRYTMQDDIVVGTVVSGRDHVDLEDQIGCFVNALALRVATSKHDTFHELVNKVYAQSVASYKHQLYPFDLIVDELAIRSAPGRTPVFDVLFSFQNISLNNRKIDGMQGLDISPYEFDYPVSKFDVSIIFSEFGDRLNGSIEYSTGLFKPTTIELIASHLLKIITQVVRQPHLKIGELNLADNAVGKGRLVKTKELFEYNFNKQV